MGGIYLSPARVVMSVSKSILNLGRDYHNHCEQIDAVKMCSFKDETAIETLTFTLLELPWEFPSVHYFLGERNLSTLRKLSKSPQINSCPFHPSLKDACCVSVCALRDNWLLVLKSSSHVCKAKVLERPSKATSDPNSHFFQSTTKCDTSYIRFPSSGNVREINCFFSRDAQKLESSFVQALGKGCI